ncbi:Ycf48-like protein [compost metagenome]
MRSVIGYLVCLFVGLTIIFTFLPRPEPVQANEPLRADRVQINALLDVGRRVLAVGERGSILFSDDAGISWHQAQVDRQRQVALTALVALDDTHLLAVGHDGWILRSTDGGQQWREVRHDEQLGEPLLGVWTAGDERVLAYGSFGKLYQSDDAGLTWHKRELDIDNAHLNGLDGGVDGRRMLVGEQGLVLRSADAGAHWQALPAFYNGSLFGVVRLNDDNWVAYGMRGHVFVSHDFGGRWRALDTGNAQPLYGHARLADGGLVIVGAGGSLVQLDARGMRVHAERLAGRGTLTSAAVVGSRLLLGGEQGVFEVSAGNLATLGR